MKEDPFRVQRDFIIECLRDIDEQKERILQLVDEACEILKAIIDTETVDILKGMHFDNVVRQARVQIKSCRRRLDTAEQKICQLSTKNADEHNSPWLTCYSNLYNKIMHILLHARY